MKKAIFLVLIICSSIHSMDDDLRKEMNLIDKKMNLLVVDESTNWIKQFFDESTENKTEMMSILLVVASTKKPILEKVSSFKKNNEVKTNYPSFQNYLLSLKRVKENAPSLTGFINNQPIKTKPLSQ